MNNFIPKHGNGIYVFEGIDNVGKTTIINDLKSKILNSTSFDCIGIAFPGNECRTLGSLVYDIHHNQRNYFDNPINEASLQLLHVASHIDLIQHKISNEINKNKIILMDRYWWSTYVYGVVNSLREEVVNAILSTELLYWKNIEVNRIFLLERNDRKKVYNKEVEELIIKNYRKLASSGSNCKIVSNDFSLQSTVEEIYNDIMGEVK